MCIIAIKDKGINLPEESILETMFKHNSDGAGFMYAKDGQVHIKKGFMTYKAFKKAIDKIEDIKDMPLVMHFRIATSGGIDCGACHPFPISNKRKTLRKTDFVTDIGVVHNGVIPISAPDNMSDTMQYISKKLYFYQKIQPNFYNQRTFMKRIEKEIKSKMVFLTGSGEIYRIGDFIEDKGIIYSNHSYESYTVFPLPYRYSWEGYEGLYRDYCPSMMLCPVDGYLQDEGGNLIDCCDGLFLIDKYNRVYEYDFDFCIAEPIPARAFSYEGLPFRYDETVAMYCDVDA